jgi:hypothetical protein
MLKRNHASSVWGAARAFAVLLLLGTPLAAAAEDVAPFTVVQPTVIGPIASTATNFPYIAEGFDVQPPVPKGYLVEEYFVSGTGNLYEYTPTGIRVVSPCPAAAAALGCTNIPYTTRMIVKRPINRHKFSGTVIVEPLNPSAGFDIAAVWDRSRDYFERNGDVFVGWSSKSVIVDMLKRWNPARYAGLNWTYAPFTPGSNSGAYDGITFDAAAQIGALFKANGRQSPIHGYAVKHVFEAGFSQDGGFTFTQAQFFHALERMPGGRPVYDGYVPGGTNGPSNVNFGLTPAGALSASDPRRRMQPRDVPVIHINTETEIFLGSLSPTGLLYRRDDSDAAGDRYRLWEVPGGSHVSNDTRDAVLVLQLNDAERQHIQAADLPPIGCAHQQFVNGPATGIPGVVDPNDFPFAFVASAAFHALTEWVEFGAPPARADRIVVNTAVTPPQIARDAFGNALGGVRTPFLDVPAATYVPFDTVAHTTAFSGFCILYGYNIPFDETRLHSLYRNHGDYVSHFVRQSIDLVEEGFWLLPEAVDAVLRAVHADVP